MVPRKTENLANNIGKKRTSDMEKNTQCLMALSDSRSHVIPGASDDTGVGELTYHDDVLRE